MKSSTQVKPISCLKDSIEDVIKIVTEDREPLIITLNGEEKFVIMDIRSYEKNIQTLAFLKILAFGNNEIEAGNFVSVDILFDEMIKL